MCPRTSLERSGSDLCNEVLGHTPPYCTRPATCEHRLATAYRAPGDFGDSGRPGAFVTIRHVPAPKSGVGWGGSVRASPGIPGKQDTGAGVARAWRGRGAGNRHSFWLGWREWRGRGAGMARACPVPPVRLGRPAAAAQTAQAAKFPVMTPITSPRSSRSTDAIAPCARARERACARVRSRA
eukprot:gene9872-biopygen12266